MIEKVKSSVRKSAEKKEMAEVSDDELADVEESKS